MDCTAISFRLVRAGASICAEMRCALIASVVHASEVSALICSKRASRRAAVNALESWYCLHASQAVSEGYRRWEVRLALQVQARVCFFWLHADA